MNTADVYWWLCISLKRWWGTCTRVNKIQCMCLGTKYYLERRYRHQWKIIQHLNFLKNNAAETQQRINRLYEIVLTNLSSTRDWSLLFNGFAEQKVQHHKQYLVMRGVFNEPQFSRVQEMHIDPMNMKQKTLWTWQIWSLMTNNFLQQIGCYLKQMLRIAKVNSSSWGKLLWSVHTQHIQILQQNEKHYIQCTFSTNFHSIQAPIHLIHPIIKPHD